MFNTSFVDAGDQVAMQLINWVNTPAPADVDTVDSELRPLIGTLKLVQYRMRVGGYLLLATKKYSAADMCGMDYVLVSERLDRYFWDDITVDPIVKRTLSTLRRRFVFVADSDVETNAVKTETRKRFLHRLLALMDSPTVLSLSGAPHPDVAFESNPVRLLRSISVFQEQLLEYAQFVRLEKTPDALTLAGQILEYREDLNNSRRLAEEECNRRSSLQFITQERTLLAYLPTAVRTAWSATIAGTAYTWKPRLHSHGARLDMKRGQIVLVVDGQQFRLDGIVRKISDVQEQVWSERAKRKPVDYELKRRLNSDAGRKLVAENLVRVLESTPLAILIGEGPVASTVAASDLAQRRYRSARPTPQ